MHPIYIAVFCALAFTIVAAATENDEPGYFVDERATPETPGYGLTVFTNLQDAMNKANADSGPRVITIKGAADPFGAQFEESQTPPVDNLYPTDRPRFLRSQPIIKPLAKFAGLHEFNWNDDGIDWNADATFENCLPFFRYTIDFETGNRIFNRNFVPQPCLLHDLVKKMEAVADAEHREPSFPSRDRWLRFPDPNIPYNEQMRHHTHGRPNNAANADDADNKEEL